MTDTNIFKCLVNSCRGQRVTILVNLYPKGRSALTLACKLTHPDVHMTMISA